MKNLAGITPSDEQARAVRAIVDWYRGPDPEFLLDGEAGTGKSTTAAFAVEDIKSRCGVRSIASGAYTAKAAKVMRDKGVDGASTIHKMIYTPVEGRFGETVWVLDERGVAATADLIVIDEVSMVNEKMANDLRSFGKKILVLGDVDGQLPPIEGAGAFTSRKPDFRLLEINRFALESPIVRLAAAARRDQHIPFGAWGDVEVLELDNDTWRRIFRSDTQVICGVHNTRWAITQMIREDRGFEGPWPQRGETLICRRNNYDLGLYNGGFGEAVANAAPDHSEDDPIPGFRDEEPEVLAIKLSVRMEGEEREHPDLYTKAHLFQQHFSKSRSKGPKLRGAQEFDWGYAITCHSAQGSEYPHVTIIDDSWIFRQNNPDVGRRWLYTSLTRASQGLTLLRRRAR